MGAVKRTQPPMTVTIKFSRTGDGPVLHFYPRQSASPEFVDSLRVLGASAVTIAAAEGDIDEVKRLGKEMVEVD